MSRKRKTQRDARSAVAAGPHDTAGSARPLIWIVALIAASVVGGKLWTSRSDPVATPTPIQTSGDRHGGSPPAASAIPVSEPLQSPTITNAIAKSPPVAATHTAAPTSTNEALVCPATGRKGLLADEIARVDPTVDGWDTEAFYDIINPELKALGKLLAHPEQMDDEHLSAMVHADFAATSLVPETLDPAFVEGDTRILRGGPFGQPAARSSAATLRGLAGWRQAMTELLAPLATLGEPFAQFKIFNVAVTGDRGECTAYFQATARNAERTTQLNATAFIDWRRPRPDGPWLMEAIRLTDYERAEQAVAGGRLFNDCTASILAKTTGYEEQILRGTDYWRSRLDATTDIDSAGHRGLAIGDVNGDGLDDVLVTDVGGLPKRLYVQQPDGTVIETSASAGLDYLDRARGALFIDFDNDGDQDLALTVGSNVLFHANDGQGRFSIMAEIPVQPTPHSLAAADYDADGDVDVYVCSYGNTYETFGDTSTPTPWHDANNGAPNTLLRNDGDWKFTDVTAEVGLDDNNRKYSFAASWDDFDNDGDQDLFVANDFGRKNLYRNDNGRFHDLAGELGADDIGAGMSAAWGDVNNDGFMDIYAGNMFSSAGNRIAFQRQFRPGADQATLAEYQRTARGNTLLINDRHGKFQDRSVEAAVTLGRWAWGSVFLDFNNDGWEDIFVSNGFVTGHVTQDL